MFTKNERVGETFLRVNEKLRIFLLLDVQKDRFGCQYPVSFSSITGLFILSQMRSWNILPRSQVTPPHLIMYSIITIKHDDVT